LKSLLNAYFLLTVGTIAFDDAAFNAALMQRLMQLYKTARKAL
jgi:hypothetical protein